MQRLEMTYQIAHAAGRDSGNRNMLANGRTKWNDDDYSAATSEFNRLLPEHNISSTPLSEVIKAGMRVTISVPSGIGRNGIEYRERTGRAVMRGPCGWVLNMGGTHGTPAVATEQNIVRVI